MNRSFFARYYRDHFARFLPSGRRCAPLLFALLGCVMLLYGPSVRAYATQSLTIWLYNSQGDPVDETSECSFQDPHVYRSGVLIGNVDANNNIDDPTSGQVIGYITDSDSP